jgi:hypothetical protein
MKRCFRLIVPAALAVLSASALASTTLTLAECHAYPFAPAHGVVTHQDLMRELTELESVGYRPAIDNYSPDLDDARARLIEKYRSDCKSSGDAAMSPELGS